MLKQARIIRRFYVHLKEDAESLLSLRGPVFKVDSQQHPFHPQHLKENLLTEIQAPTPCFAHLQRARCSI